MSMARQVLRLVGSTVTAALVVVAVALAGLLAGVPAASGGTALTVWTGSMDPAIPAGSVVVVRPVNPFRIEPGDVITYQVRPGDPTFVTHRVVEVKADAEPPSVITKGDANPGVDPDPVEMQWIRGQVLVHVPHLGSIGERVGTPAGVTAALALFGGGALLVLGRNVVTEMRKAREQVAELPDRSGQQTEPPPDRAEQNGQKREDSEAEAARVEDGAATSAQPASRSRGM
jgi:signal peptidase I